MKRILMLLMGACLVWGELCAAENMIGRQSQNEGVTAVPLKSPVRIDGDLAEWDLSGQIWSFADLSVRERFSVRSAAMWDAEYLYLAFLWKDPLPLNSNVDPDFNAAKGWVADALQLRVVADGQTSWFTTWYYGPKKTALLHLSYWKDESSDKKGQDQRLLRSAPGEVDLGEGAQMAYALLPDKSGFVQEVRIPWKLIFHKERAVAAGQSIKMGMEFLWGDPTGNTWPMHRYADNMAVGATSREFFWTAKNSWGNITLADKPVAAPRTYQSGEEKLPGVIPVRATVPAGTAAFTLVIENEQGERVRNLAGDFLPADYAAAGAGAGATEVVVNWDGLDDAGKLVAPGTYRVRGLVRGALGASYELCFYNPGTPAWETADGSGAWGADHAAPGLVARAGDWTVIGWEFAEGGSGVIGVAADGKKKWGEKRGVRALTGDADFVYAVPNTWDTSELALMRLDVRTGAYRPFEVNGEKRKFELPLREIFAGTVAVADLPAPAAAGVEAGSAIKSQKVALAAAKGNLAIAFGQGRLALLKADSAQVLQLWTPGRVDSMAFAPDGQTLYLNNASGVRALAIADGQLRNLPLPAGLAAGCLSVDVNGNLLALDPAAQQIKAYSPDGTLLYSCGKQGGRPVRGAFDREALSHVSAIAADARGQVWATEKWNFPRRVGVWGRDGKLVRDYVGNTGYAGTGCLMHDNDPSRAYVGPMQLAVDYSTRGWKLTDILWVPQEEKGERFLIEDGHAQPTVFRSRASGQEREYLFVPPYRNWFGYVVLLKTDNGWRPVSYIGTVGELAGEFGRHGEVVKPAAGEFAQHNLYDGVFWNDADADGKVAYGECEIIPAAKPGTDKRRGETPIAIGSGWGGRMNPDDLSFYAYANATGLVRYAPDRFTAEGAPVFQAKGVTKLQGRGGDLVPVPGESTLLVMSGDGGDPWVRGSDARTGEQRWRYPNPYPQVHGSHNATMPKPGLLIGPLKILGVADTGTDAGKVFLMRGNLGQDFYLTTDGLYVGAMFQDGRLPGMTLPKTEAELAGMPLELLSHGSEPFNGWFGRHDDGKFRMTCGLPRQAAMVAQITGLDTLRRISAPAVTVDASMLAQADADNSKRARVNDKPAEYGVRPWNPAKGWKEVPSLALRKKGQPEEGTAQLAWSAEGLHLRYAIKDATPWRNEGKDFTRLFKTGDCVDFLFSAAGNRQRDPVAGDGRIVFASLNGKPAAVMMRAVQPGADKADGVLYHSPVGDKRFDVVKILPEIVVKTTTTSAGYVVETMVPWRVLGITPTAGLAFRGDAGFILSDAAGTINAARVYWANPDTNLVSDLPLEAWLYPARWGELRLEQRE